MFAIWKNSVAARLFDSSISVARTHFADCLGEIHASRGPDSDLYTRRVRELVGDGECIMGIADTYPHHPLIEAEQLQKIEHCCLDWRWRLKEMKHRLRRVHGDFHPWNNEYCAI